MRSIALGRLALGWILFGGSNAAASDSHQYLVRRSGGKHLGQQVSVANFARCDGTVLEIREGDQIVSAKEKCGNVQPPQIKTPVVLEKAAIVKFDFQKQIVFFSGDVVFPRPTGRRTIPVFYPLPAWKEEHDNLSRYFNEKQPLRVEASNHPYGVTLVQRVARKGKDSAPTPIPEPE